jgi:hypothetical protein
MSVASRWLLTALALHLFCIEGITQPQSRVPRNSPARLTLVAAVDTDPANSDIILKWSLKNISNREISLPDVNLFMAHKFIVKDQKNRAVQLTRAGQQASMAAYFTSPRRTTVLGPGQELTKELKLSDYFNMKAKGVYTIVVERRVPSTDAKGTQTIRSNILKVRVEARHLNGKALPQYGRDLRFHLLIKNLAKTACA